MSKKNLKKTSSPKLNKSAKGKTKANNAKPTTSKSVNKPNVKTVSKPAKKGIGKTTKSIVAPKLKNGKSKKATNKSTSTKVTQSKTKQPVKKLVEKKSIVKNTVKTKSASKKLAKTKPTKEAKKSVIKQVAISKNSKKPSEKKQPIKNTVAIKETKKSASKEATKKVKTTKDTLIKPSVKTTQTKPVVNPVVEQKQKDLQKETPVKSKSIAEPKGKFELEYVIHSSPVILFEFLVSPSGLSEWFCDDVNIRNENFTFFWDGAQQVAKLTKIIEEKLIRFEWVEKTDGSYFEFRIEKDELTNDISLIVTDFAENDEEKKSSTLLWNSQIDKLLHVLGSYF
jgi:uncharacterized protein YndB with AHSA1/START domain